MGHTHLRPPNIPRAFATDALPPKKRSSAFHGKDSALASADSFFVALGTPDEDKVQSIGVEPIGSLAEECARDRRYEFLLVSVPLHVEGGIASPPNAVAIK